MVFIRVYLTRNLFQHPYDWPFIKSIYKKWSEIQYPIRGKFPNPNSNLYFGDQGRYWYSDIWVLRSLPYIAYIVPSFTYLSIILTCRFTRSVKELIICACLWILVSVILKIWPYLLFLIAQMEVIILYLLKVFTIL